MTGTDTANGAGSEPDTPYDRVLVTGATGTVGSRVRQELAARAPSVTVRAASRRPPADAAETDVEEWVRLDLTHPETWGAALADVDAVFLLIPPGGSLGDLRAFVDAAGRVGVAHVVLLSVLGAGRLPVLPHRRLERHLAAASMTYTALRASFFLQNLTEVHAADLRERGELFVPAGDGRTSVVDAQDVAAVAAVALSESGHADRVYDVTGPAALTYHELAATLADVLDRPVRYADPSVPAFVRRQRARGLSWGFVLTMVGIYTTARLGLAGQVSDDVDRVLGRPPRSVADFATANAAALTGATDDTPAAEARE